MVEKLKNEIYLNGVNYVEKENIFINNKLVAVYFISKNGEKIRQCDFLNFDIKCPDCNCLIRCKKWNNTAHNKTYYCKKCRGKGERNPMFGSIMSEEERQLRSDRMKGEKNHFYGKKHTDETKKKISENNTGRLCGENNPMYGLSNFEYFKNKFGEIEATKIMEKINKKISKSTAGEKNHFYGKKHTDKTRKRLSESLKNSEKHKKRVQNEEYRNAQSERLKNRVFSNEHRRRLRLATIRNRERSIQFHDGEYRLQPAYNKMACFYFDKLMLETNTHIRHAENGGEYFIKELGYWVDGYDIENNIVYEFDEQHHFRSKKIIEKDKRRQEEITNFLNCEFIRIKYDEI